MKIFTTKVSAIILSTLIICNKYPAIGNKSFFFTPVYAAIKDDVKNLSDPLKQILSQMNLKNASYKIPEDSLGAYRQFINFMINNAEYINNIPPLNKDEGRIPKELKSKKLVEYVQKRLDIYLGQNSTPKDEQKLYTGLSEFYERLQQALTPDQIDRIFPGNTEDDNDNEGFRALHERIFQRFTPDQRDLIVHQVPPLNTEDDNDNDNESYDSSFQSNEEEYRENNEEYLNSEYDNLEDDEPIEAPQPISDDNSTILSSSNNDHNHLTPRFHSTVHKARTLVFPQISRKVRGDKDSQLIVGASSDNYIRRHELEVKYLYGTTTLPQKNGRSKSSIHGLLINLKRKISNKLTIGGFYSPTVTNTTFTNKVSDHGYDNHISGNMDHLFGIYTSYAITPVTYLSNQIAFGITIDNNSSDGDKNDSNDKKYPNYFIIDSFISHKINIDATKTIAPEFGLSYYSSNSHIPYKISNINNLSLITGIKFQYKYQYKNVEFCPSIKLSHVRPLYSNITEQIQKFRLEPTAGTSIDLLRDFQSTFDPHSSISCSFAIRHGNIRLESGYGFTTYHNIEHNYTHTLFAKLNLSL